MSTPTLTEVARAIRPGPVFVGLIAAAVLGGWMCAASEPGRNAMSIGGTVLLVLAGWVLSLCLHEFAHAVTAFSFGDRNAELRGYLTLNPLRYTHPGLSLVLPLLFIVMGGIGFPGGAVYVEQHGFSRIQRTLVSLAGPAVNIVLAVLILAAVRAGAPGGGDSNLWAALAMLGFLQVTAAVLNLLPVPGFDGYGAIEPYLSPQTRSSAAAIAPYGFLIVLVLLLVPAVNRVFFDAVLWLFELSGVPARLAMQGWGVFLFWR